MRHPPLYLPLTAAAGCILPMLASSETVPDDALAAVTAATAAEVRVAITGRIGLAADRGRKVFIELLISPKLTAATRVSLASSGLELVDTREQADAMYELDNVSQALRPATRHIVEIRAGDYVENPAPLITKGDRGGLVMLLLDPLAVLIGMIASNVGNATGAQDSVNAATTSDLDGKCLPCCGTWHYRQRNVVNLTRKEGSVEQKCSILATTKGTRLMPARLIQSSLAGLQEAVGLVVTPGLSVNPALTK